MRPSHVELAVARREGAEEVLRALELEAERCDAFGWPNGGGILRAVARSLRERVVDRRGLAVGLGAGGVLS